MLGGLKILPKRFLRMRGKGNTYNTITIGRGGPKHFRSASPPPDQNYVTRGLTRAHPAYLFAESTTPPHEQLPVVFESTDDPSLNLTRTDLNCDKTGTCYDGQYKYNILYFTFEDDGRVDEFRLTS